MRIATFNVYWFGTTRPDIVDRTLDDDALIARVLARLDADVVALQEVCDLPRLERVLQAAATFGGRALRVREGEAFVTSARPHELADGALQKVVYAWDPATVDLVAWGALGGGPALRPPLLATFRDRRGATLTAAALHLKSGIMGAPLTDPSVALRHREAAYLARWLDGAPIGPSGPLQTRPGPTVLAGDLNARVDDPSIAPLRLLSGWAWPAPLLPPGDPWTTWLDREVIDHLAVSPGARFVAQPRAFAFDHEPALGGVEYFHLVDGFHAQRARNFPRAPVENLYRVSDHRPVVGEIVPE